MELTEILKKSELPNIIFGAGIVGEVIDKACETEGIKIDSFCDNNKNKTMNPLNKKRIYHVPELKKFFQDANFLVSSADINDVVNQLKDLGYNIIYPGSRLIKNFDISKEKFRLPEEFVRYALDTAILCQENFMNPEKLFMRSLDIIVTEKCSLKCRDCSNLMIYYKSPKDEDTKTLINEIDRFCEVIDEINEFRVLGGEPFMNREANRIIKRLIKEEKSKKVIVYTNGTIVPKNLDEINDPKLLFIITDYGNLSRNLNNLVEVLKNEGIQYYVQKVGGWTDCSKIIPHNRNQEEQKEIFRKCCAKNTITLSKGKIYRCPFSANAHRLSAIPDNKDYVDIFDGNIEEVKQRIKSYLLERKYLESCDFCNGRSFGDPEIIPAIQIKKPIEYKSY